MKKIFTLLWLSITVFAFKSAAQGTTCNAGFSYQLLSFNTVKFNPVTTEGAPLVTHTWSFGDGSPVSNQVSPTHVFATSGNFPVVHTITRVNQNNTTVCTQSFTKVVTITQCDLVVDFNWTSTTANNLVIAFHNLSVPLSNTDSITWHFGDGQTSNAVNPVHTYANSGTYTVCLRVKKLTPPGAPPCVREICKTLIIPPPCNLVVNFNWNISTANPLMVHFQNLSVPLSNTDSITWHFGDGQTSNAVSPVHTYVNAGTYTVCLRVKKLTPPGSAPCVREICRTVVIPPPCNLVVDFNWTVTPNNPLRIEFHNLINPIAATDSIRWTFGDGTSSNQIHPIHTYTAPGTYTVCLRIIRYNGTNTPCIREICKTIVIPVPCNLVVNFTSQPDPNHPLRIKFTNTSTPSNPSDSVRWIFGDGTSVSGLQSDPNIAAPTHNYANAGTYTVCLRVKKNNNSTPQGSCVREICRPVVVTPPCNFNVNFSWHPDSLKPRKIYFTNLSTPPTATAFAVWTFGDGTGATTWNAVHEYAQPGAYRVCLKVYLSTNSNCFREICDTVYVTQPVPPCTQLSKFHFEKFSNDNQKYKFTPDHINTTWQYTWTFGDGTGSHDIIAVHRYAQPGTYTACLTVWRGPDCASTTCHQINVQPQITCDTAHVSYTYLRSTSMPNKISFIAQGTLPIIDQTWTISRVGSTLPAVILHQNNPTYTFMDTGYYRVCLRAVLLGGCVKEYCNYVRIEQVSNACTLQAYPNPATAVVNVNVYLAQPEMIHAFIYNAQNVLVLTKDQQGNTGNNVVSMDIHNLAMGQYTIRLIHGNSICFAAFQKL